MHRNRQGGRDRRFMGNMGGGMGGDGLLGEGPGMGGGGGGGGFPDQMMNQQLLLAQSLLQQQQALTQRLNMAEAMGGDPLAGLHRSMGGGFMQRAGPPVGFGGMGRMNDMGGDRKRMGPGRDRNMDAKRRRQDSTGRGGDRDSARQRGRDSSRSGEGNRDRNRTSRWDSDDKVSGKQVYDPADPTEVEDSLQPNQMNGKNGGESTKDGEGNLYCHVCNVSVYDDESFRRHLNGTKHAARMNSVLTVHEMKSNQLKSRLKAEEHLRNIERKGGHDPEFFCKICNNDLTIPWKRHCFSNIHKQRLLQVRRGCGWCNVHNFTNFSEVLEHRETEEHKKNAEIHGGKKEDRGRKSHSPDRRKSESDRKKSKAKQEEDLTIPEFDAEKPVGLNYIIPVTGFFCKLCHKFYNNEKSAKGAHCQTEAHYEKFKAATEAKIEAREKRRAEEEEARKKEEEELKAKKEKEAAEKEGDDEMKEEKEDDAEEDMLEGEEPKIVDVTAEGEEELSQEVEEDMEDYDDELPLVDEDGEGGTVAKEEEEEDGLLHPGTVDHGAFLDDTNADASFEFLSGDMAQAHLELQKAEQLLAEKRKEEEENDAVELADSPAQEASSTPAVSQAEGAETPEAVLTEEEAEPTPKVTPTKATRGRGTARRGRGRGRGKK